MMLESHTVLMKGSGNGNIYETLFSFFLIYFVFNLVAMNTETKALSLGGISELLFNPLENRPSHLPYNACLIATLSIGMVTGFSR